MTGSRSTAPKPEIPAFSETRVAVWSWLGRYDGEKLSVEEIAALRAYVEQGGILILFGPVPTALFSGESIYDLAPGAVVLGAAAYQYGKPNSQVSSLGEALFGEEAADYNPYPAMDRRPNLGKPDGMKVIFGEPGAIELGVHRIGRGAVVYSATDPKPDTPYAQAMVRLLETLQDNAALERLLPSVTAAAFWGNHTTTWQAALEGLLTGPRSAAPRPEIPVFDRTPVAVWSWLGRYEAGKLTAEETAALLAYVQQGGLLVLDGSVPAALFSGESVYDLAPGAALLGAAAYRYGTVDTETTERARTLFGEDAERYNPYPAAGRHPYLGALRNMAVIFGSADAAQLGVHRIGQGAVVYSTFDPKPQTPYAEALTALLTLLLDSAKRDSLFPAPAGNGAAEVHGERLHLAIAGADAPAVGFLEEKLAQMTGQRDFSPLAGLPQLTLHIGKTPYVESLELDFDSLHPYGYYLVCRDGRNVVIAGKHRQGTLYAVNDFLKRYAGYRHYAAGRLFEIVPEQEAIVVPASFAFREEPSVHSYTVAWTGNSNFGRTGRTTGLATHALDKLVPPERFAESHPAYFPEIDGERRIPRKGMPWNPCITHPDMPKLVAEYADRYFEAHPENLGLPMGVNDGGGDCQCERCLEVFRRTGNQYAEFYNMAARVLAEKYPDKVIAFIAYSRAAQAVPRGVTMEPNILVEITAISLNAFDEMPKWQAIGIRHFGIYDYIYTTGSRYVVPRYYPNVMGEAWRSAWQQYGLKTMWMEYYPTTTLFDAPRQHVLDELAWNMETDIDALLTDYFQAMYAEAAPAARRFFDILEAVYARKDDPLFPMSDNNRPTQLEPYTFGDLERLDRELAAATAAVRDPLAAERLALLQKLYALCRLHIESYLCGKELRDIGPITSEQEVQHVLKLMERGYGAVAAAKAFTLPKEEEAEMFPGTKKLADFKGQSTLDPLSLLERHVDPTLAKVTAWLEAGGQDVARYYLAATEASESTSFRAAVLTQVYLAEHPLVNLVKNPSFEDEPSSSSGKKPIEISDHQGFKGVPNWSTWTFPNSVTRFFLNTEAARTGRYSGAIGERQTGGALINYVALESECRYRLGFWVRRNRGDDGFGCGQASVRMQQKGQWLDQGSSITIAFTPETEHDWVYYETTFSAPAGDGITALLLFSPPPQPQGIWTAIDDVSLEKIYDPQAFISE